MTSLEVFECLMTRLRTDEEEIDALSLAEGNFLAGLCVFDL